MLGANRSNPAGLACDVPYPSQMPAFNRIDADGMAAVVPESAATAGPVNVDPASLLGLLKPSPASISRRTCPDLFSQLEHALAQRPATILCNLMDDDGPPPVHAALAAAFAGSILVALASLRQSTSASAAICMPTEGPDWLRKALAPAKELGIEVRPVELCYPNSHPSLLLPLLLGKRLGVGRLPTESGVLVLDAFAAAEIGFILQHGRGMGVSPLAIGDHVRAQSHYLLVPPEMSVGQVLTILGGSAHDVMLLAGDLPGERLIPPSTPAGQCAMKLHILPHRAGASPAPCTRCGACLDHCPTGAHPAGLLEAAQQDDPDIARRAGIDVCILCGVCSLVCPSQLPLVRSIRTLLP